METNRKLLWEVTYKDTEEAFGSKGDGIDGIWDHFQGEYSHRQIL